jgi:uncharacterized membrane protein HdeD (DUF308 family)
LFPIISALVLYGGLAMLAVWSTRHDRELVWLGGWLAAGFVLSNLLHATLAVTYLPGPYSLIECMVLFAASIAWGVHRKHWPLLVIACVNVLSITANIAFAANFPPSPRQIFLWELTTNIFFAVECLLATAVGVADGYRTGRFVWLPPLGRWRPVSDDPRKGRET